MAGFDGPTSIGGRDAQRLLLAASTPMVESAGRSRRGLLAGLRCRGFGLPTPAEWRHSVSYWQPLPSDSKSRSARSPPPAEGRNLASLNRPLRGLRSTRHLRPAGSFGPATSTLHSASRPPAERLRRWAQRPAILMNCNSRCIWLQPSGSRGPAAPHRQCSCLRAGVKRWVKAANKRYTASDQRIGSARTAPAKIARPPAPAYDPTDNVPRSPTL